MANRRNMNSKQRAYLKGLAMNLDPVMQIGKASLTDEIVKAVCEVLEPRELIKISVLKNCADDPKIIANEIAGLTRSEVVQIIGKKIVLYKQADEPKNRKINLPK